MKILLVAATVKEIDPFLKKFRDEKKLFHSRHDIDILVTGAGLMATAAILSRQINLKRPGLAIQAGVAGGFGKKITPGEVVVVTKDRVADQGVMEINEFKDVFDLGLAALNKFPYRAGWLENRQRKLIRQTKLKAVAAISVNQVSTGKLAGIFADKYDAAIESMEGAAFHFVCLSEKIPFLQLRAVSNSVGERNKEKWELLTAIRNLNEKLSLFLQEL